MASQLFLNVAIAALSVLGTLIAQHFLQRPKLCGRIIVAVFGESNDRRVTEGPARVATVWLFLSNPREIPVVVVDYRLEALIAGRWHTFKLLYQDLGEVRLGFQPVRGKPMPDLIFPSSASFLTHRMTEPITPASPRGGALSFVFPEGVPDGRVEEMRITAFDGYGHEHVISHDGTWFHDPNLLLRLAPDARLDPPTSP